MFKKAVSLFLTFTFIISNVAFAAPQEKPADLTKPQQIVIDPEQIVIPRELGLVKSKFTGNSGKLVIHIQDAHCNYEAQTNIAHILENLVRNYNLNLVSVEGADGLIDTSWFKAFPDDEVRKEVATYFMKKGEITGPEFLSITTDYPIKLFGAETRSYYIENLNAFTSSYPLKEDTEKYFNQIKTILNKLKNYIYNEELKTMDVKAQDYESKKIQFNDYVRFLETMAGKLRINLREYDHLFKLISALIYEKKIDFNVTDKERGALIDELSKKLSKDMLAELVTQSLYFKSGKVSSSEYYNYLKTLALKNGIELVKRYPNLSNYIIYNSVYSKIENEQLFNDIKNIEIAIKEKLFKNDDQRTLEKLSRHADILVGLVNIKLLNGDFEYYKAHKEEFSPDAFTDFIKKKVIQYGLSYDAESPNDAVATSIPKLEDFYSIAMKRDKALVDNTLNEMKKEKFQTAVLVTGGFHSDGIAKLLEKQGISYMVVCPTITKDVPSPYIQILTNQRTPFEDILAGAAETKQGMLAPVSIAWAVGLSKKQLDKLSQEIRGTDLSGRVIHIKEGWLSRHFAIWIGKALRYYAAMPDHKLTDKEVMRNAYILTLTQRISKLKALTNINKKAIIDEIISSPKFNEMLDSAYDRMARRITPTLKVTGPDISVREKGKDKGLPRGAFRIYTKGLSNEEHAKYERIVGRLLDEDLQFRNEAYSLIRNYISQPGTIVLPIIKEEEIAGNERRLRDAFKDADVIVNVIPRLTGILDEADILGVIAHYHTQSRTIDIDMDTYVYLLALSKYDCGLFLGIREENAPDGLTILTKIIKHDIMHINNPIQPEEDRETYERRIDVLSGVDAVDEKELAILLRYHGMSEAEAFTSRERFENYIPLRIATLVSRARKRNEPLSDKTVIGRLNAYPHPLIPGRIFYLDDFKSKARDAMDYIKRARKLVLNGEIVNQMLFAGAAKRARSILHGGIKYFFNGKKLMEEKPDTLYMRLRQFGLTDEQLALLDELITRYNYDGDDILKNEKDNLRSRGIQLGQISDILDHFIGYRITVDMQKIPDFHDLQDIDLGARLMMQHRFELERLARAYAEGNGLNPDEVIERAIKNQKFIIHVNDLRIDELIDSFKRWRFFGFPRENIVFVVQDTFEGYRVVDDRIILVPGNREPYGHGYALMQTVEPGMGFVINENGGRDTQPFAEKSPLEYFQKRGATFMANTNVEDLTKLMPLKYDPETKTWKPLASTALHTLRIAQALYLIEDQGANVVVEGVKNKRGQKGGSWLRDIVNHREILVEGLALEDYIPIRHIHTGQIFLIRTQAFNSAVYKRLSKDEEKEFWREQALMNKMSNFYDINTLLQSLPKHALPNYLVLRDGTLYLESITGDVTQLYGIKAVAFSEREAEILSFKKVGTFGREVSDTEETLRAMLRQDEDPEFRRLVERLQGPERPGHAAAFTELELPPEVHKLLNQASEEAFQRAPEVRPAPVLLKDLIKDTSKLAQLTEEEKNMQVFSIAGWIDRFKELYRDELRKKGLREDEYEPVVAKIALQLISHPSTYSTQRGEREPSMYMDELYYRMLQVSENPDDLFISLVKHERFHIDHPQASEEEVRRNAPIDNVIKAIKARTVLVVQGGGDCAGLDKVLSAAAQSLAEKAYLVVGVHEAYKGLMAKNFEDYLMPIDTPYAKRIAERPSTDLKSSREDPKGEGLAQLQRNIEGYRGVIVTGGDDHLGVTGRLAETIPDIQFIGIPKSIDADAMTQMLGFVEASKIIQNRFWRAMETGEGRKKVFIAEIMGRKAGWLTRASANRNPDNIDELKKVIGSEKVDQVRDTIMILIPEKPVSIRTILTMAKEILLKKGALNIAVSEGFGLSDSKPLPSGEYSPLWNEFLHKNPLIAAKVTGPPEYDIHGNLRLAGASEFVLAILQTRWDDESLNLGLGKDQFRHTIPGYIGRGAKPSSYGLKMAERYVQKAAKLIAEGKSGLMVTYPDRANPFEEEPTVRPINKVLTFQGEKLARNLTTLGEGSKVYGPAKLAEQGFPIYTDRQLAEEGVLMQKDGELYSYTVSEGKVTARNTVHKFESGVWILWEDLLSTGVSGWAHNRGSIFDVPDDHGLLTLRIADKNQSTEGWSARDKASWEKMRDTIMILLPGFRVSLEEIVKRAQEIKKKYGTVNIVMARGFTFNENEPLFKQLLEKDPYLRAKYLDTRVEVEPGIVRVKDNAEFIQGALVAFANEQFPEVGHARCNQLSNAYYVEQPKEGLPIDLSRLKEAGVMVPEAMFMTFSKLPEQLQAAVNGDKAAYKAIVDMPKEKAIAYFEALLPEATRTLPEEIFGFGHGYDIRGNAQPIPDGVVNLTPQNAYLIGKLLGTHHAKLGDKVLITGDIRNHTPILRYAMALGLASVGVNVDYSPDFLTTGAHNLLFTENQGNYRIMVQISGSHNIPEKNGFKIKVDLGKGVLEPLYARPLQTLYESRNEVRKDVQIANIKEITGLREQFVAMLDEILPPITMDEIVVIDARAGAAGPTITALLEKRGVTIIDMDKVSERDLISQIHKLWQEGKHRIAVMLNMTPDANMRRGVWDPSQAIALEPTQRFVRTINANLLKDMPKAIGSVFDCDVDRISAVLEDGTAVPAFEITLPYYQRFLINPVNQEVIMTLAKAGFGPLKITCDVRTNSKLLSLIDRVNIDLQERTGMRDRNLIEGWFITAGYPSQLGFMRNRISDLDAFVNSKPELKNDADFMEKFEHLKRTYFTAEASGHNFFHISKNFPSRVCDCAISGLVTLLHIRETMPQYEAPALELERGKARYDLVELFGKFPSAYSSNEVTLPIPNNIKIATARKIGAWLEQKYRAELKPYTAPIKEEAYLIQPKDDGFVVVSGFKVQLKDGRAALVRWSDTSERLTTIFEGHDLPSLIGIMKEVRGRLKEEEGRGLDLSDLDKEIARLELQLIPLPSHIIKLDNIAGIPIALDITTGQIVPGKGLTSEPRWSRPLKDAGNSIANPAVIQKNPFRITYYGYRNVRLSEDTETVDKLNLRFDITVLQPGVIDETDDREFIMTKGHIHPTTNYPEFYEVWNGYALYVQQGVNPETGRFEVIVTFAQPGDKVLLIPGYSHRTVNIGNEPLVMANWISDKVGGKEGRVIPDMVKVDFSDIEAKNGYAYHVIYTPEGVIEFRHNTNYGTQPADIRFATPVPAISELALSNQEPMYPLVENKKLAAFLNNPKGLEHLYEGSFTFITKEDFMRTVSAAVAKGRTAPPTQVGVKKLTLAEIKSAIEEEKSELAKTLAIISMLQAEPKDGIVIIGSDDTLYKGHANAAITQLPGMIDRNARPGAIVIVRGKSEELQDKLRDAIQKAEANGLKVRNVVTQLNSKASPSTKEALAKIGILLDIDLQGKNLDEYYMQVIRLFDLSLKIAYEFKPEDISATLSKITGKTVSIEDVMDMLAKKILEILPRMEPIDTSTAVEAYRAVRQALTSL